MIFRTTDQEVQAFKYGVHEIPAWAREISTGMCYPNGELFLRVDQSKNPNMLCSFDVKIGNWCVLQPKGVIFRYESDADFYGLFFCCEEEELGMPGC